MKVLHGHEYAASAYAPGVANSVVQQLLVGVGFTDVRVWNSDDAEDPEGEPGNRDGLPDDFPKGLRLDPTADHWIEATWTGDDADVVPPKGLLSIADMGDVSGDDKTPPPKPGPTPKPGPGPAPKPKAGTALAKSGGPTMQQVVAMTALVVGVATIIVGAYWIHTKNTKKKRKKKRAASPAPRQLTA